MADAFSALMDALHRYLDGDGDPDTLRDTVEMVIAEHEEAPDA
jgi:hypothetical protein